MANALTGRAAVFGLDGALTFTGIASDASHLLSSAQYTDDAEVKQDLIDPSTGECIGKVFGRKAKTCTIDVIPVSDGAPNTLANAAAAAVMPAIPCKVTLSAFKAAELNADWLYEGGGSISLTPDGYAKLTLPLKKYADSSSTATILTTAVS
jgi:hypothetical protein